jgi:hypothetical protein
MIHIQESDHLLRFIYRDNETKTGKFIFDDDSGYNSHAKQKARHIQGQPLPDDAERPLPRTTVTTVESDCPVENGVVRTKWGSVSLGAVLAGLTAGLYPQQIPVQNLVLKTVSSRPLSIDLASALIDNKYAATLVGMEHLFRCTGCGKLAM